MNQPSFSSYQKEIEDHWKVVTGGGKGEDLKIRLLNAHPKEQKACSPPAPPPQTRLAARKRKQSVSPNKDIKKRKMADKEEIGKMLAGALAAQNRTLVESIESQFAKQSDTLGEKIGADIKAAIDPISESLDDLKKQSEDFFIKCDNNSDSIIELGKKVDLLKDSIRDEIKADMKKEMGATQNVAFQTMVAQEVEKSACNVIIHGVHTDTKVDDIKKLFNRMEVNTSDVTVDVKPVQKIGESKDKKSISVLVILGDAYQRNAVLRRSFPANLPKDYKVDKDVPRAFRAEYKRFKRIAWKRSKFVDATCRVAFVGHEMQIRYKDNQGENKGYTICETFTPTPQNVAKNIMGNRAEGGHTSNSCLNQAGMEKAQRSILILDPQFSSEEEIGFVIEEALGEAFNNVVGFFERNKTAIVVCSSVEYAKSIAKTLVGKKMKVELFE